MGGALPTGVVTFLFTDIEGSTKLWERCPDAMRDALAVHDALLRDHVERHQGAVFKTVGDASFCAFERPHDAVFAAAAAQRALHAQAWPGEVGAIRVRMGIHSGECSQRDGDYFGPAVNRVARLASIAYGEQVLLSATTASLVREAIERGAMTLRDLGASRLKGLSRAEPTFQLVAEGLRADFPALAALEGAPHNLPAPISSFVGRDRELEELAEMLARSRLLTICGPGGIGKTRLALQLADSALERYRDGVWFVGLTAAHDPQFVAQSVATALGVQELPNEPIENTLLAHLSGKSALLVIDNSEQVLAGVAQLARLILTGCATVTIVTTSREPLHVGGEAIYRVGPLADDGAQLFLERARQAAPAGQFGPAELREMGQLCRKLEGIPLAIELACARLSAMTLKQLARRLTSVLALRSKDSTESPRHRTLRDTIAWSYDLLPEQEKAVFRGLAVFRGSFDAGALRDVIEEVADVDDAVGSLVDKSLVALDAGRRERYRLLDVVREYAAEQLDEAQAARAAGKHAAHYAALAAAADGALDEDVPNIRAALDWTIRHDVAASCAFIRDLVPYWRTRGLLAEARSWTSRALEVRTSDADRAALLGFAASFASLQDELAESLRLSREALTLYGAIGDLAGAAQARFRIAEAVHRQGHLERAETLYREALQGFSACRDARGEMICLGNLGMLARQRGELRQAAELLDDAARRAADVGEQRIGGEVVIAMGWVQLDLNDLAHSRKLFERAFAQKSDANDRYGLCAARQGLATVALKEGRLDVARAEFLATLDAAHDLQAKDYVARALHGLAALAALDGAGELAARLLGLADRLFRESGRELRDSIAYDMAAQSVNALVPEPERSALREEGARMQVLDAVAALKRRLPPDRSAPLR